MYAFIGIVCFIIFWLATRILIEVVNYKANKKEEGKIPNKATLSAMAELEAGDGKSFNSVDALMADLDTKEERNR